jgi:hypothetical protein
MEPTSTATGTSSAGRSPAMLAHATTAIAPLTVAGTELWTILPTLLTGGIGALVALAVKLRPERDNLVAGASKATIEGMRVLLDAATARAAEAEATVGTLRAEAAAAQRTAAHATHELEHLRGELEALRGGLRALEPAAAAHDAAAADTAKLRQVA